MPALIPTEFTATIVYLGRTPDRDATLMSEPLTEARLTFAGIEGEAHGGLTRPSCARVTSQHPKGTTIRNTRQLSVMSQEELDLIAGDMGVGALGPEFVGASLVIKGIPDFTLVPPSSRLQADGDGATLILDMENRPCHLPAKPIDTHGPGQGRAFKAAAKNRRGVTASVEREGTLSLGQTLRLHIPGQPVWPHLDHARG
ncbi:MAG: sulfurase [Pseudomonadota bacterium]